MYNASQFTPEKWAEAVDMLLHDMPSALWETLYITLLATFFAILIGLPLGILLVVGEKDNIMPIPAWIMKVLDVLINILRSLPFVLLAVVVLPLTRTIVGTGLGNGAFIITLTVAAFPFIARLVEGSVREINPNIIEAALSMGATPMQIVLRVILPECVPSLISNATVAITTILGYTAMSGVVGGGGLGQIAYNYGYQRFRTLVMLFAVIILVLIVQLFQTVGTFLAVKCDKRKKVQKD